MKNLECYHKTSFIVYYYYYYYLVIALNYLLAALNHSFKYIIYIQHTVLESTIHFLTKGNILLKKRLRPLNHLFFLFPFNKSTWI